MTKILGTEAKIALKIRPLRSTSFPVFLLTLRLLFLRVGGGEIRAAGRSRLGGSVEGKRDSLCGLPVCVAPVLRTEAQVALEIGPFGCAGECIAGVEVVDVTFLEVVDVALIYFPCEEVVLVECSLAQECVSAVEIQVGVGISGLKTKFGVVKGFGACC